MEELWAKFIAGFCKVDFLCYQETIWHFPEPNWLGWVVIVVGGLFATVFALGLIISIFE